jgi:hypothetical protein
MNNFVNDDFVSIETIFRNLKEIFESVSVFERTFSIEFYCIHPYRFTFWITISPKDDIPSRTNINTITVAQEIATNTGTLYGQEQTYKRTEDGWADALESMSTIIYR